AGDTNLLQRLFDQVRQDGFTKEAGVHALKALSEAARQREARPPRDLQQLASLMNDSDPQFREQALRLAGVWKLKDQVPLLIDIASGSDSPEGVRQAAFDALREIGGKQVVDGLTPLTTKKSQPAIRRQAILGLAALNLNQAVQPAVDLLLDTPQEKE